MHEERYQRAYNRHHQGMETKRDLIGVLDMLCETAPERLQWDRNRIANEFAEVSLDFVRPSHAREALVSGNRELMNIGGHKLIIATQAQSARDKDFVILILAHADMDMMYQPQVVIDAGYRLYGNADEVAQWAASPRQAFAEMLDRYGIRFTVEGQRLLWLPMMMVTLPEDAQDDPEAVARYIFRGFGFESIEDLPEHAMIARVGTGEDGRVLVAGPTMINLVKYRDGVNELR